MEYFIGIDLGGSSAKCILVTPQGDMIEKATVSFDPAQDMEWARNIRGFIEGVESAKGKALAIGVAAPGLASRDNTSIAYMPGRLKGLEGLHWGKYLNRTQEVPVLNDAHAALMGEVWLGAAKGLESVFLLTLGTGVGGAILINGELYQGTIGRAGHLGHTSLNPNGPLDICNTPGSLELEIGTCTVSQRSKGRFHTTQEVVEANIAGDPEAQQIWLQSLRALAASIVSFVNVLDPQAVLIGGGVSRSGEALFKPLQKFIDEFEWRPGFKVPILPTQMGEYAGAYGSAYHALLKLRK